MVFRRDFSNTTAGLMPGKESPRSIPLKQSDRWFFLAFWIYTFRTISHYFYCLILNRGSTILAKI